MPQRTFAVGMRNGEQGNDSGREGEETRYIPCYSFEKNHWEPTNTLVDSYQSVKWPLRHHSVTAILNSISSVRTSVNPAAVNISTPETLSLQ